MNHFVNLPPTQAGAMLNLSDEIADMHRIIYEIDDAGEGYVFKGVYDPEAAYKDNSIIVPLNSVFQGTSDWFQGKAFANVLESSKDKGYYNGKVTKWKDIYIDLKLPWEDYEDGNYYDYITHQKLSGDKFICDDGQYGPYGGHVVEGTMPQKLTAGSVVYIVPICPQHNTVNAAHTNPSTPGNGNGFYMKLKSSLPNNPVKIVRMTGYVPKNEVANYL